MHTSALSEVFHHCLQLFVDKYGKLLLTFRTEFMRIYAGNYAEFVIERGGDLQNCVGFIDGTKVNIAINGGYYRQRSV